MKHLYSSTYMYNTIIVDKVKILEMPFCMVSMEGITAAGLTFKTIDGYNKSTIDAVCTKRILMLLLRNSYVL